MNWPRMVGVFLLSLGATGCATSSRRVGPAAMSRGTGVEMPADVVHAQNAPPPGQPDIFMAAKATRESSAAKLSRYFPGLGRTTPVSPATSAPTAAQREAATTTAAPVAVVATPPARPSWFAFRKATRGPQTYVTDVRGVATKGTAEPAYLPVALQVPVDRIKDRAVTVTAAEEAVQVAESAAAAQSDPPPSNPDSSSAPAEPLRTDEPRLAVKPFPAGEVTPPVAPTAADPGPSAAGPDSKPAEPAAEPPTESAATPPPPEPAARVASAKQTQTAPPTPEPNPDSANDAAAGPGSAGDPGHSLGLPPAMLPATYTQHSSVAVRGSHQGSQPPPVLASPQVEASPQSAPVATTGAAKTWQRPCLRRMIRRLFQLGEFANPPTAQPH